MKKEFTFLSSDNKTDIHVLYYIPEGEVKAILQISHGMVEYIERYENFAEYLNSKGILVCGNDHLGHGTSVISEKDWGYFGEKGEMLLVKDLYKLTKITKEKYPGVPYFLLGHSMGSFLARMYLCMHSEELTGAIVMGTGNMPEPLMKFARFICKTLETFKGERYRSAFVNNIALGANNKRFEPSKTPVDWLCKDDEIKDKYIKDPRCTFVFTLNGFYSLFSMISYVINENNIAKVRKDLPILVTSGEDDPVGDFGKAPRTVYETYKKTGIKDVSIKMYKDDRHEILNELDKETVYEDIYNWLKRYL